MRQLLPLLVLATLTGAVELPAPQHRPQQGTLILTIVPTERDANRICGQTDPRITTTACSRSTGIIIETPCSYPHERYARLLCHELAHQLGGMIHMESKGKLVWVNTRPAK